MNIFEQFGEALTIAAEKPALISGLGKRRRVVSFASLDERVDAVVSSFVKNDLHPGDKVLVAVPLSIETYVVMLATLKAGMVVMFVDPGQPASQIARILRKHPPVALVGPKSVHWLRYLLPELRKIPRRFVVGKKANGAITICSDECQREAQPVIARSSADSAMLTFTSGTGGSPKAVVRTHGFLREQLAMLSRVAPAQNGDIDLVAMPMFVLFNLANAMTSVIPAADMKRPGRADPRIILQQLLGEKATRTVASPALLDRLANYCLNGGETIADLRIISTGGGPIGPTLMRRLAAVAPNATIKAVYGSTEAEPIAVIHDEQVSFHDEAQMREGKGLLAGRPVRGCAVRILHVGSDQALGPFSDEAFANYCLPTGSIGEIVVSGSHVLTSYEDPVATRKNKIRVQGTVWHRTGDAGYFDDSGRLWLVGRCSAAIHDRHGTVYPFQVEYAVSAVRGVRRAALIARNNERVLVLETSGREFRTELVRTARCIADNAIDRIITVRRIPVDSRHDAKIDYPALERLLDGRLVRIGHFVAEVVSNCIHHCHDLLARVQARTSTATRR
jgi:acyl-CoA synthetase (AMP-forming)/AMP-acid ligase II